MNIHPRMVSNILQQVNYADVIVGEDAGHPNEIVYAVKNKNAISEVEL